MKTLEEIKGIGQNTIRDLKALGINDINDLVTYYPFRYEVIEKSDINTLEDGDKIVIDGICENVPNVYHFSRKLNKMSFRLNTGDRLLNITIFNRSFLKQHIKVGTELTVIGKYDIKHNSVTANDIMFGLITRTVIEPVYHSSFKISSKKIHKLVNSVIKDVKLLDYIPSSLNEKYLFMDKDRAAYLVHNPVNMSLT